MGLALRFIRLTPIFVALKDTCLFNIKPYNHITNIGANTNPNTNLKTKKLAHQPVGSLAELIKGTDPD